jgi:hypothetical protein
LICFVHPAQALLNSTPQLLARDRRAVAHGAQLGPAICGWARPASMASAIDGRPANSKKDTHNSPCKIRDLHRFTSTHQSIRLGLTRVCVLGITKIFLPTRTLKFADPMTA